MTERAVDRLIEVASVAATFLEFENHDAAEALRAAIRMAEDELGRRREPVSLNRLISNGYWMPHGSGVAMFVRSGVSIAVKENHATGDRVASVFEMSTGSWSPAIYLQSMTDVDDLVRLFSRPPAPMLMIDPTVSP